MPNYTSEGFFKRKKAIFSPTNTVQIPQMHKAFNYVTIKQKLKANLLQTGVWECA